MEEAELEALMELTHIPLLGSIKIRLLMEYYGSAREVLKSDLREIANFPGFGEKVINSMLQQRRNDHSIGKREMELAKKMGVHCLSYLSPRYPRLLLELPDFPPILYVKGEFKEKDRQSIAIVGTRHMSIYGSSIAHKIAQNLASAGMTIISGLARGIDTVAHRAALSAGRTFAIIGSGLGNIYPQENVPLANAIAEKGALISEFPLMTPPDRQNFPQRNRIISGMAMGTVLIEAPLKSGAMITMEYGQTQGKKLFACPGRIDMETFQGNHFLIKRGIAQLAESAKDILDSFGDLLSFLPSSKVKAPLFVLEKEEKDFLALLPKQELSFDEIASLTAPLSISKLSVLLMSLILKKALKEYPGKIYKKVIE